MPRRARSVVAVQAWVSNSPEGQARRSSPSMSSRASLQAGRFAVERTLARAAFGGRASSAAAHVERCGVRRAPRSWCAVRAMTARLARRHLLAHSLAERRVARACMHVLPSPLAPRTSAGRDGGHARPAGGGRPTPGVGRRHASAHNLRSPNPRHGPRPAVRRLVAARPVDDTVQRVALCGGGTHARLSVPCTCGERAHTVTVGGLPVPCTARVALRSTRAHECERVRACARVAEGQKARSWPYHGCAAHPPHHVRRRAALHHTLEPSTAMDHACVRAVQTCPRRRTQRRLLDRRELVGGPCLLPSSGCSGCLSAAQRSAHAATSVCVCVRVCMGAGDLKACRMAGAGHLPGCGDRRPFNGSGGRARQVHVRCAHHRRGALFVCALRFRPRGAWTAKSSSRAARSRASAASPRSRRARSPAEARALPHHLQQQALGQVDLRRRGLTGGYYYYYTTTTIWFTTDDGHTPPL